MAWLMVGICSLACSKAGEEQSGKRAPIPPPPPESNVPAELSIPVSIDGADSAPITAERLDAIEPDFADHDRRAWRLSRLVEEFSDGAEIEAVGREGVSVTMQLPASDDDLQPVLFLTRRGDVVATLVRPEQPFPPFHGQGGRLRRPGDTTPRVMPVVELRVHSAGR